MTNKTLIAHVLIHGFALAHATTAAALSQTIAGDEAALTALTITMIMAISSLYNQPLKVSEAFAVLGIFAGHYLGTRGMILCVKWIPGIGNIANAIATTVTTETLGWITVFLVSKGQTITNIKKNDAKRIIKESEQFRKEHKKEWEEIKTIVNNMNENDKKEYKFLINELQKREISDDERKAYEEKLTELFRKNGLK